MENTTEKTCETCKKYMNCVEEVYYNDLSLEPCEDWSKEHEKQDF